MRGHRHHGFHHHHHSRPFLFGRRWGRRRYRPIIGGCGMIPLILFFFCILPLFLRW